MEPALKNLAHLFAVVSNAAARAAQREARPQDHGVADARGKLEALLHRVHQLRLRHVQPDFAHGVLEQQPVFGLLDRVDLRADQFHSVPVEDARLGERHREIQAGLAAHR